MKYTISINQPAAMEMGLNLSECAVMSLMSELPMWADRQTVGGADFYLITDKKIAHELPLVSNSPATFRRIVDRLVSGGFVEKTVINRMRYLRLTEAAMAWVFDTAQKCAPAENTAQKCAPAENTAQKCAREALKNEPSDCSKMSNYYYTNNKYTRDNSIDCAVPATNEPGGINESSDKLKKTAARKTRLPDDFLLTTERANAAYRYWETKNRHGDLSAIEEFANFRNHHTQHGKTMACWEAAWRTWYINAVKYSRPPGPPAGQQYLSSYERAARATESITNYEKAIDF